MRGQFLLDRIDAVKAQILIYEAAVLAVGSGGMASYTIDTGQTKTTVTRSNISTVKTALDSLYNSLASLEARAGCGGSVYVRPIF